MIAGRRLFLGETDYQTVKLVQQANVPSLARLNPEVDDELEAIVMKSLAANPDERHQSARELGDDLASFLFGKQLKVTSYDIANLVKEVVARKSTTKKGQPRDASIIDRLIQEELLRFTSLDDMGSDPLDTGQAPLSPDDVAGAQPLDAGLFENPADWFANDDEVGDAIAGAAGSTDPKTISEPGWRESGLDDGASDLANLLEESGEMQMQEPARLRDPTPAPSDPLSASRPSRPAGSLTPTPQPPLPRQTPAPAAVTEEPPKSGGAMKWVVLLAILLIAGGAAAYFGGLIPI